MSEKTLESVFSKNDEKSERMKKWWKAKKNEKKAWANFVNFFKGCQFYWFEEPTEKVSKK